MFLRASKPLGRLLSLLDDVLGDPIDEAPHHPHRRPLRWQYDRRGGAVLARPAECISPVRPHANAARSKPARRPDELVR